MNTNLIKEFLRKQNVFAVVGVSSNSKKYGHRAYKREIKQGSGFMFQVSGLLSKPSNRQTAIPLYR